jgi:hypothetical protein
MSQIQAQGPFIRGSGINSAVRVTSTEYQISQLDLSISHISLETRLLLVKMNQVMVEVIRAMTFREVRKRNPRRSRKVVKGALGA